MREPAKKEGGSRRSSAGVGVCIALLIALIAGIVAKNPEKFDFSEMNSLVGAGRDGPVSRIPSTLYDIAVEKIPAPMDKGEGGAIATLEDDVLLITRLGAFFRLAPGDTAFRPIALTSPNEVIQSDIFYRRPKDFASLGYKDLILRVTADEIEITVSEARIDRDNVCVGLVVSQASLHRDAVVTTSDPNWREVWRSQPCIRSAGGSFPFQSGGDMAFMADGRLAIFVGDFGVDGHNRKTDGVDPQANDNDYGKIIAIETKTGAAEILSRGHRNPGGLAIGPDGALWQSEHGAQGGDEINRIVPGRNYGWPLETYGVHYGTRDWPLDETIGDHDRFERPIYAFVPSMAMSSLARMSGQEFPLWGDDLILGTLKYQRLMRLHIRESRVIFAEPLPLGARVRDLTIDPRGAIYVKDDVRPFVYRLTNGGGSAPVAGTPQAMFAAAGCTACHDGSPAAPSLENLMGRDIASDKSYSYSAALKGADGVWTRDALRAFISDPQAFAPGVAMPTPDLTEAQIDELVASLEG